MEADLVQGKIGDKGDYDVAFVGGNLVSKLDYTVVGGVGVTLEVKLGAEAVLNALKVAIPGHFDDAIIDAAIALLKK